MPVLRWKNSRSCSSRGALQEETKWAEKERDAEWIVQVALEVRKEEESSWPYGDGRAGERVVLVTICDITQRN